MGLSDGKKMTNKSVVPFPSAILLEVMALPVKVCLEVPEIEENIPEAHGHDSDFCGKAPTVPTFWRSHRPTSASYDPSMYRCAC